MDILSAFFAAASGAMLFSLVSETSAAETSGGSYMIPSNGQITCGEFLSDSPRSQATDTEWVLGYISGEIGYLLRAGWLDPASKHRSP
jgi:hypothetical protein